MKTGVSNDCISRVEGLNFEPAAFLVILRIFECASSVPLWLNYPSAKSNAALSLPSGVVHAAGRLARRLHRLSSNSSGTRRSHPANAGRRRACCRRGGHAPSLRSRPAARRTIPALLEGRAARRSGAVVALQPKCQQDDCPALPLYAGVDAGIAAGCHCAVDSSRRALSATAQPLGRPVAQRRQSKKTDDAEQPVSGSGTVAHL